jgi:signal transduction histidine kinase
MTRRLVLSYLLLTMVLLAVLEIPLAVNHADRLHAELEGSLVSDGFALAGFTEDAVIAGDGARLDPIVRNYHDRTNARLVIVQRDGRVLGDSQESGAERDDTLATRDEIAQALSGRVVTGTRHSDTLASDLVFVAVPVASGGAVHGAIRISYSTEDLRSSERQFWLALAGIAVVSLVSAAALGMLLARWVNRPLRHLLDTARVLGSGDLGARAYIGDGPPEVKDLATAFNTTAARLEDLMLTQESFVADASHELRTPLAALRLRIENLQAEAVNTGSTWLADDLEAAANEVQRLARLVGGLLTLARIDRAPATDSARVIPLAEALAEREESWLPVADEHGLHLSVDVDHLAVLAGPDRLAQALDNLLANAIEASPPGATVRMIARRAAAAAGRGGGRLGGGRGPGGPAQVEVQVIDDGPGLTRTERLHAFDRFWRASTKPGTLGGTGLGLPIARRLARLDGGDLELDESETGGIRAILRLPAAPSGSY